MNIKNTVSLSAQEAVELLSKIADSLEQSGEFAFDLKGQEVSIEAGEMLTAQLSISPEEFSIVFNWGENVSAGEQKQPAKKSTASVKNIPRTTQKQKVQTSEPIQKQPEHVPMQPMSRRALPDRMPLNTTTLPLDAGYWAPAFTAENESQWTQVSITSELENKRWASDDQITSLSDLTPTSAKPKKIRSKPKSDDDLFSELDKMDEPKSKISSASSSSSGVEKVEVPHRNSAKPAASVSAIPKPGSAAPPASRAPQPTNNEWREPSRENNQSNDDWVKPSQVLQQKQNAEAKEQSSRQSIPSPTRSSSNQSIPSPTRSGSKQSIPSPKRSDVKKSIPSPQRSNKNEKSSGDDMVNEVLEWKEPTPEENTTDDNWVKPSEFLKQSEEEEESDDAINRPPPKAPDAKKDDNKKKGWASWD